MKKYVILLLLLAAVVFCLSAASVSSQDIDVENMDKEQLMLLLQTIVNKLEENEQEAAPAPTPTPMPTPTAVPEPVPDVSGTDDKEELLALMQAIMQKLQENETQGPAEKPADPETPEMPGPAAASAAPEEEASKFLIYENKKLQREKLPDSMFVQPEKHGDGKDKDKDKDRKKDDNDSPLCKPGCHYTCGAHSCRCVCG